MLLLGAEAGISHCPSPASALGLPCMRMRQACFLRLCRGPSGCTSPFIRGSAFLWL